MPAQHILLKMEGIKFIEMINDMISEEVAVLLVVAAVVPVLAQTVQQVLIEEEGLMHTVH